MLPLRIAGATRIMAVHQDEYHALAIRDEIFEDGTPCMVSAWEPTPKELAMLNAGGAVVLRILGTGFPPVMVGTQPAPEEEKP